MTAADLDFDRVEGECEAVLSEVPSWLWDGRSLPVPVDEIVDSHFSLLVREVEDMSAAPGFPEGTDPAHLSGLLLAAMGEIWVNRAEAARWPQRRRFTVGHELGHWVMHRSGQQSLFCRHQTVTEQIPGQLTMVESGTEGSGSAGVETEHRGGADLPLAEAEANFFAASLLMPRDLFRAEFRRCKGDVVRLQERFDCSEKATRRRIATIIA